MRLEFIFFGVSFVFLTGMEINSLEDLFIGGTGAPRAAEQKLPNMRTVSVITFEGMMIGEMIAFIQLQSVVCIIAKKVSKDTSFLMGVSSGGALALAH